MHYDSRSNFNTFVNETFRVCSVNEYFSSRKRSYAVYNTWDSYLPFVKDTEQRMIESIRGINRIFNTCLWHETFVLSTKSMNIFYATSECTTRLVQVSYTCIMNSRILYLIFARTFLALAKLYNSPTRGEVIKSMRNKIIDEENDNSNAKVLLF